MPRVALYAAGVVLACGVLLCSAPLVLRVVLRDWYVSHGPHSYHKVKCDMIAIENACAEYATQHAGESPPDLDALVIPDEEGFTLLGKEQAPLDPWSNPYGYERPGPEHPLRIFTYGSDEVPGGKGDARDVDNLMIKNHEI